jgi:RHS repeat-associated protein
VNGLTTEFTYDSRNRVVRRTSPNGTLNLTYSGWNLIEERDASGTLEQTYVHGAGTDELLVKITASGPAYYHHDGLGSTIALTGENGELLESYRYDAFGGVTVYGSSGSALPASPRGNRFLFTGREWLGQAGIYDYRNRVYSPGLGRFLQADPIRFSAGDVNIYRYVGNGPVNWIDPLGLINWSTIGSAFEGKIGFGLGLEAKGKISKLEVGAGLRYSIGSWGNLSGDVGNYVIAQADLLRVKAGNNQFGLGCRHTTKTTTPSSLTESPSFTEENDPLLGWNRKVSDEGSIKGGSNDWFKVGAEAKIGVVDIGGSVNFGTIWQGLWE